MACNVKKLCIILLSFFFINIFMVTTVNAYVWNDYENLRVPKEEISTVVINILNTNFEELDENEKTKAIDFINRLKNQDDFNGVQADENGIKFNNKVYDTYEDALNAAITKLKDSGVTEKQDEELEKIKEELDKSKETTQDEKNRQDKIDKGQKLEDDDFKNEDKNIIYNNPEQTDESKMSISSIEDTISDAEKFVTKGEGSHLNEGSLSLFSQTISGIFATVAIVVAVIMGGILGIKFMIGGIDEKTEVKQLIVPYIVGCIVVFGAFAIWQLAVNMLGSAI